MKWGYAGLRRNIVEDGSSIRKNGFALTHRRSNHGLFLIALIILGIFTTFLNLFADLIIDFLMQAQKYDILNRLSASREIQDFTFYQGELRAHFIGPWTAIVSSGLFLWFCLISLHQSRFITYAGAVFIFLFISKFNVLFYPPYGDALIGPFSDAVWLVRHQLDYLALLKQDSFTDGGPLQYPLSVYPLFLAGLLTLLPPVVFLIVIHLCTFFFAAVTVASLREILLKVFKEDIAVLGSVLLLMHPVFQSMTELINLEMPCLFFAMLSAVFLSNQQFARAAFFAVLSLSIKSPGIIACLAVFFVAIVLFIQHRKIDPLPRHYGRLALGTLCVFIGLAQAVARQSIVGEGAVYNRFGFMIGWPDIRISLYFWVYLTSVIALIVFLINAKKIQIRSDLKASYFVIIMMFFSTGMWFLLYMQFSVLIARYQLYLLPFFLFSLIFAMSYVLEEKVLKKVILVFLLIFGLNAWGQLYRQKDSSMFSHNTYERSLEYRNDLKLNLKLVETLEQKYADYTVGAPLLVAQMLNFDEVGYVKKPFDVVVYGMPSTHEGIKEFKGLRHFDLAKTIWVGYHQKPMVADIPFPIGDGDIVTETVRYGKYETVLFKGGFAIERSRLIYELYRRDLLDKIKSKEDFVKAVEMIEREVN